MPYRGKVCGVNIIILIEKKFHYVIFCPVNIIAHVTLSCLCMFLYLLFLINMKDLIGEISFAIPGGTRRSS